MNTSPSSESPRAVRTFFVRRVGWRSALRRFPGPDLAGAAGSAATRAFDASISGVKGARDASRRVAEGGEGLDARD